MAATGLDVFDKTLQTTNTWLSELMETTGPDRRVAWHVLGAVMRPLRDRLPLELAVHLGAQLPLLVRGLYFEQWHAPAEVERVRDAGGFLDRIQRGLSDTRPVDVKLATAAVFTLLDRHIPAGQLDKVRQALPSEIRALWPDGAGGAHQRRAKKADGHDRSHARTAATSGESI